jgi:hypothetical protein
MSLCATACLTADIVFHNVDDAIKLTNHCHFITVTDIVISASRECAAAA